MVAGTAFDVWAEPAPRPRRWIWAAVALLLAAAAAAVWWLWPRPASAAAAWQPTAWVQPQVHRLAVTVTTTGTVRLRPGSEVRVGSQVSGIVTQLDVAVGSSVEAGQVIARLDPAPLQAKVDEAQADLAAAQVARGKTRRDRDRALALLQDGLIPRQQFEDVDWQDRSAAAQVASARAALAAAQVDLGFAVIRAPIAGVVASVSTQQGETVAAAFAAPTFVTIVRPRDLELDGLVDETDIGNVRPGDPVSFTTEAFPDRVIHAVVAQIEPAAVLVSGVVNYSVVARIPRIPDFLRPDMTTNLTIQTGAYPALTVPDAAIRSDLRGSYVWLARGTRLAQVRITTGARQNGWTEVVSGVRPGDRLALGAPPGGAR